MNLGEGGLGRAHGCVCSAETDRGHIGGDLGVCREMNEWFGFQVSGLLPVPEVSFLEAHHQACLHLSLDTQEMSLGP